MTATANELLKRAVDAHAEVLYSEKPDQVKKPDEDASQDEKKGKK